MAEHASLIREETRADAVPHPLVLRLDEPMEPVIHLLDARGEQFPFVGRLRRPQVGRQISQIDVIIAGDQLFWHSGLLLLPPLDVDDASYDRLTISTIDNESRAALA